MNLRIMCHPLFQQNGEFQSHTLYTRILETSSWMKKLLRILPNSLRAMAPPTSGTNSISSTCFPEDTNLRQKSWKRALRFLTVGLIALFLGTLMETSWVICMRRSIYIWPRTIWSRKEEEAEGEGGLDLLMSWP